MKNNNQYLNKLYFDTLKILAKHNCSLNESKQILNYIKYVINDTTKLEKNIEINIQFWLDLFGILLKYSTIDDWKNIIFKIIVVITESEKTSDDINIVHYRKSSYKQEWIELCLINLEQSKGDHLDTCHKTNYMIHDYIHFLEN